MNAYSQHVYQSQAVETAGPAQLVLMLFDGALAAVTRARLSGGAIETINRELQKAQAIVTELRVTLDLSRGGVIAANLASLYDYCLELLVTANMSKDLDGLDPVELILRDLRDSWEAACCNAPATTSA